MRACQTCGNSYEKAFTITMQGKEYVFDSFECAIQSLAPICQHCGCKILGHGLEYESQVYCCSHCARRSENNSNEKIFSSKD